MTTIKMEVDRGLYEADTVDMEVVCDVFANCNAPTIRNIIALRVYGTADEADHYKDYNKFELMVMLASISVGCHTWPEQFLTNP